MAARKVSDTFASLGRVALYERVSDTVSTRAALGR
jgi:hypothetical protein